MVLIQEAHTVKKQLNKGCEVMIWIAQEIDISHLLYSLDYDRLRHKEETNKDGHSG